MFNRFFKKEDNPRASGPPGPRTSQSSNPSTASSQHSHASVSARSGNPNTGGGFFNLPPSVPLKVLTQSEIPSGQLMHDTNLDIFNGMAVKHNSTLAVSRPNLATSNEPSYPNLSPSLYNSQSSLSVPNASLPVPNAGLPVSHASLQVPNATPPVSQSSLGSESPSLFSGLEVVANKPTIPRISRKAPPLPTQPLQTQTRIIKTKKKKKTFRPGFGRQLSDENVAALQSGERKEEEIEKTADPMDLSSLLPPLPQSTPMCSVLAGLTVHCPMDTPAASNSVLAGLTVHIPSPPKQVSPKSPTLSIHSSEHHEIEEAPIDKFSQAFSSFQESVINFRLSVHAENELENRLQDRKAQLKAQLKQYEMDLKRVEISQQRACEEEDFEKADALNTSLNSVRHCMTLAQTDLRKLEMEANTLLKAKKKTFLTQLKTTRKTSKEIDAFCQEKLEAQRAIEETYRAYEEREIQHLRFENERIATELHHVNVNLKHVNAEKEEIEATISEHCKQDIKVRETLESERYQVQIEVSDLERQLAERKARVQALDRAIQKAESDISTVRNRFSRQSKRISDREHGILRSKAEVETDSEMLERQKTEFTETLREYQARLLQNSQDIACLKKSVKLATLLTDVLQAQESRRQSSLTRTTEQSETLHSLLDELAAAEQSVNMLQKQELELEKTASVHVNALKTAESTLPKLEMEKKAAAAQRNFKDAAKISKDIKALEKDRSVAEEAMEMLDMELKDVKHQIEQREKLLEGKKEQADRAEKELETAVLVDLYRERKFLQRAMRRMAVYEDKSEVMSLYSSALMLLETELEACEAQIHALELKYGPVEDEDMEEEVEEEIDDEEDETDLHALETDLEARFDRIKREMTLFTQNPNEETEEMDMEQLATRIAELENEIEDATASEEYELAAQLDEQLQHFQRRFHALECDKDSEIQVSDPTDETELYEPTDEPLEGVTELIIEDLQVQGVLQELIDNVTQYFAEEQVQQTPSSLFAGLCLSSN